MVGKVYRRIIIDRVRLITDELVVNEQDVMDVCSRMFVNQIFAIRDKKDV